ncbi:hypothetical protein Nepgr_012117 [Nepenthes gracilis]|uniref:Uncharacterized protein n=1 Tax=Nepenthes gracilis TaxID=150966 RepID=A0AAD3XN03_NEPGR|nr:hypothetical protein Nepgr_012117 [Nepenthes gracilis]
MAAKGKVLYICDESCGHSSWKLIACGGTPTWKLIAFGGTPRSTNGRPPLATARTFASRLSPGLLCLAASIDHLRKSKPTRATVGQWPPLHTLRGCSLAVELILDVIAVLSPFLLTPGLTVTEASWGTS